MNGDPSNTFWSIFIIKCAVVDNKRKPMWLIRETQNQSYIELISAISACFSPTTTNWIDTNKKLDDINLILCYKVTCTISIQQWSSFAVNSIYEPSLLIWSISLKNMRNKESRHKKQEESNWKVFQDHLTVWHSHQLQTSYRIEN